MQLTPYLFFNGRCEEAIEFYKTALGAKVEMLMRFKESPEPPRPDCTPADLNKIMHASFSFHGVTVMASDGIADGGKTEFKGVSLSLAAKDEAETEKTFNALAQGGQVFQPLTKTFFSPKFGMVQDKFGVQWMVMAQP